MKTRGKECTTPTQLIKIAKARHLLDRIDRLENINRIVPPCRYLVNY